MLRFWFDGNVDGVMTHPVDGKVYPRYLVWHPRDHVEQRTVKTGRPGDSNGAVWRINEFFLSSKPSGWTAGDDPAEWAGQLYTKVDLTVRRLGPDGLALGFQLPGLGVSPVSLTHEVRACGTLFRAAPAFSHERRAASAAAGRLAQKSCLLAGPPARPVGRSYRLALPVTLLRSGATPQRARWW